MSERCNGGLLGYSISYKFMELCQNWKIFFHNSTIIFSEKSLDWYILILNEHYFSFYHIGVINSQFTSM